MDESRFGRLARDRRVCVGVCALSSSSTALLFDGGFSGVNIVVGGSRAAKVGFPAGVPSEI